MRQVLIALSFLGLLASCQMEDDVEKPVVSIESPVDNQIVYTADGLRLVATLTDNTGLLQYKLVLTGIDSLNDVGADSTSHLIFIEGVANSEKAIYIDDYISLSDTTFNGFYRLTLTCIDVEGNEAIRDTVAIRIRNSIDSEPPVINALGPVAGDTLSFGEGFSITGNVTDSQSLIYSDIYVGRTNGSHEILTFGFSGIVNNTVDYDGIGWYFQVDSTWNEGAYHMYITAWDNYSGVSHEIPFYVFY